jgi:hypothetical protein
MSDKFLKTNSWILLSVSVLFWLGGRIFNEELFLFSFIAATFCLPLVTKFVREGKTLFVLSLIVGGFLFLLSALDYVKFSVQHYGQINSLVSAIMTFFFAVTTMCLITIVISNNESRKEVNPRPRWQRLWRLPLFHLFYLPLVLVVFVSACLVYFGGYHLEVLLVVSAIFQVTASCLAEKLRPHTLYRIINAIFSTGSILILFCFFYRLIEIGIGQEIGISRAIMSTLVFLLFFSGFLDFANKRWFSKIAKEMRHISFS